MNKARIQTHVIFNILFTVTVVTRTQISVRYTYIARLVFFSSMEAVSKNHNIILSELRIILTRNIRDQENTTHGIK
jgi:hypothetical protein